jgi:hypothetical protein
MIGKFNKAVPSLIFHNFPNNFIYYEFKTIIGINRSLNQCILIKKIQKKLKSIFEVNGHYGTSNSKFGKC